MKPLNSLFSLTPFQFKVIYISWTVLAILFGGTAGYVTYTSFNGIPLYKLMSGELEFTKFPFRILALATFTVFLTINVVLFYLVRYYKNFIVIALLNWLPICIVILFTHWQVSIRGYITGIFVILVPYFVISHCIVWIKRDDYFKTLETKKEIRDENLNS